MFGFFGIALNEEKWLKWAVRSWLSAPCVQGAVVVEGCVRKNAAVATAKGLSTDKTGLVLKALSKEFGSRFVYLRHGWAADKTELQNVALRVLMKTFDTQWVIIAGADELYRAEDLGRLASQVEDVDGDVALYPFHHFWRRPDLVALGSSWSVQMHRCYRKRGPMRFVTHNSIPAGLHGKRHVEGRVYHYVGMADWESIAGKLRLYHERDGHRLKVVDTWTNWRWGESTQWTHGGGRVERYIGAHPKVIADIVWDLLPKRNGSMMVAPWVPWEGENMKTAMLVVEEETLENAALVSLIADVVKNVEDALLISMDARLVGRKVGGKTIGGFIPSQFSTVDLNICFGFPYTAGTRPRNLLLTRERNAKDKYGKVGFVVVHPSDVEGYADLLLLREQMPKYTPILPSAPMGKVIAKPQLIDVKEVWDKRKAGLTGQKHRFTLVNTTKATFKSCRLVSSWRSASGVSIAGAARASVPAPELKPGKKQVVQVPIPAPPMDVGSLMLDISLKNAKGQSLGIGIMVPMRLR